MKTDDLKRNARRFFTGIALLAFGMAVGASAQSLNDFRTVASGNWDSLTTWERYNGTTWVTGYYPTNAGANVVTIRNGHTVTVAAAVTSDQVTIEAGGQVTVNSAVTWTINDRTGWTDLVVDGILNVAGTLSGSGAPQVVVNGVVINSGTFSLGAAMTFNTGSLYQHNQNGGTIPSATWNAGSTCEIVGITSTAPSGLGQGFHHFTWNCAGQTAAVSMSPASTLNGDFTVANTGSGSLTLAGGTTISGNLAVTGGQLTIGGITITVNGSTTVAGTLAFSSTTGTKTFGSVIIQSGGTWNNSINEAVSIKGNFQCDGSFTSGTAAYTFDGTGAQDIGGSASPTFASLTIANTAQPVTASANFNVSGTLSVSAGAVFEPGPAVVINNAAPAGTLSGSGTIKVTRTASTPDLVSQYRFSTYTLSSMTVDYAGNGDQTISNLGTHANLKTSGSGTKTLGGDLTVSGVVTVGSGTTLNGGSATLTLSSSGTPLVVNGTFNPSTSTVAYTSTTGANVTGGINYYNLTVNSSGDTFTAAADFTVQNVLTVASGTTFNANGKTITLSGSGTPFSMSGSFNAAGSTIVYASATGANVSALVYSNLSIAGSGTFALAGSPTIVGTLTLSSGDLSIGANTLTLNGPVAVGSGTLTGGASASLNIGGSGAGITLPGIAGGLNNLTLNRANGATLTGPVSVGGTLTLTSGQLAGASNLTLGNGASISRAAGSLDAAPTFAGTVNVTYTATGVTTGPELPASDSALNNLTINSGVAVTLGSSVTVNGTLTIAASTSSLADGGNTLSVKGTISNSGAHSSTGAGKIRFNGTAAQSFAGNYGNVEIANAAGVSLSGTTAINGNLSVTTGQLTVGGITLTVNGTTTIASTLAITGTSGTKTFGSVIIQSGATWNNSANEAVSIKGNFQCDGSFTSGTAAYTFDGTAAQDIGGSASPTFASLTIANTTQPVTASGNFNVTDTLSVSANAVLEPASGVVINSAAPAGTLSGSGTIKVTRTAATPNLVSQYRFSTYTLSSMTVDYAGNGDQTISNPGTHANLKTSGSGTKTLGGDLTVSGVVTVGSGTTLNGGSAILTLSGGGTPFVVHGTFTPASGTVRYTSTAAANNVTGGISYNNLIIAAGAVGDIFTVTGGNLAINGDLTINAGTLDLGGFLADRTSPGGTLTLANSTAAKLKIGGTGTLPANYSTHVIGASSTVEYGGSTQTIAPLNSGQSYGNLITSGSGTKSITDLVEVAGTLTVGGSAPVVVQSGGVLRNQTTAFTLNGTLSFASGATYRHERNGGTIPTATWNSGSTCEIVGVTSAAPSGLGQAFGHFTWNSPSQTAGVQLSGALTTVNGNLTIQSTGSGSIRLTTTTSPTLIIGGNLVLSGGTLDLSSTTGSASTTISVGGDLSISGTGVLTESGSGTTNTVAFPAGTHAFSNSGSIQNTVHFVVNSGATLNMGTSAVTGAGNFTLNAGATLGIGSPDGIAASGATGNVRNTGTRTFSTGANYTYNGSVAQVVGTGLPATVNNLTIANPAGVTLNSTHTVAGTCTVESGALLRGTGTINGVMVVNGTVAPGLSIGTFTVGASPTLNGTLLMEIDREGSPNADKLVVSGNPLAFGGTLVVANIGAALQGGEQFDLFDATAFSGAFSATNLPPLASGLNWWAGRLYTEGKLVVNRAPTVANAGFSRGAGTSLKIKISDLLAGCSDADAGDGDSIAFDSVNSGLQGATVTSDANYVFYLPANNNNDTLVYKVRDQRGGTNSANISITVTTAGGLVQGIDTSGGGVTVHFSGIPGYRYDVERSADLNTWMVVDTITAPANGQFSYTDPNPPQPMAYYRLKYNP